MRDGSTPKCIPHITVCGAVRLRSVLGVLLYAACHATAQLAASRPSLQHRTQATSRACGAEQTTHHGPLQCC
jgi:hypothetical protein